MLGKVAAAAAVLICCCTFAAGSASAATLPNGFVDEFVGNALVPTAMATLPDGAILVTQKDGYLRRINAAGQLEPQTLFNVRSRFCNDSERGLLGVAVDPNFSVNRFFYLYWTLKRSGGCGNPSFMGPVNRVTRHVLRADGAVDVNSEYVVLDNIPSKLGIHNAGDLEFGKDGYLYVSVGDGGCHYSISNQCADANTASRERNTLLGKVLRVTRDGNPAPGNPSSGGARCRTGSAASGQVCAETYLRGFRNPFRFAFDPNAAGTRFFVNDVGSRSWEEVNEAVSGSDYGWNLREGPCVVASTTNCGATPYRNPVYAYSHTATGCSSITGGAFVPNDLWPAPYAGSYLFGDFTCGKIFRLVPQGTGYSATEFGTGLGPITNMEFAPVAGGGRALYYIGFENDGMIRRIRYVGAVNRPPDAALQVQTSAPSLTVGFDASGSSDPDGDAISFRLDPGDGSPVIESVSPSMEHTYADSGRYEVTLTVVDEDGATSAPLHRAVVVGDQPPSIEVVSPAPTHEFSVGEELDVHVRATDPEDGELPPSSVEMWVERAHDTHVHPWVELTQGNRLTVTAPPPEDMHATRNSFLKVFARATDSKGQRTTHEFHIKPNVVLFLLKSNQYDSTFTVNGYTFRQDTHLYSWEGWAMNVTAQPRINLLRRFLRWEDTKSTNPQRLIVTPAVDSHYRAHYGCC